MLRRVTKQIAEKQINGVLHGVVYETHHLSRATTTSSTHTFEFVLCHAAGFCKEMWRPVIDALAEMGVAGVYHSLDLSGHGSDNSGGVLSRDGQLLPMQSDTPTGAAHPSWWDFGNDVLAVCEHLGPPKPNQIRIGVGHSLGGASIALSQLLRPGLFQSMLLIEPIILGPPDVLNAHKKATKTQNPLYTMTKKRRDKWSSVEVAKSYFASRRFVLELVWHANLSYIDVCRILQASLTSTIHSAFQNFSPEAVDLFVGHGLYQDNDGDLHLACRPNFEAEIYVMPGANVWDDELSSIGTCQVSLCLRRSPP